MNTATEILRKEHEAILRMLDVTNEVARRLDAGETFEKETLDGLLEFFRLFADRCHHGKEEDLLFPLLEAKGIPRVGGPIGAMLEEHDMGRSCVKKMAEAAEALAGGDRAAGALWAQVARQYTFLLHNHIQKENEVLFVMAERVLTPDEQTLLAKEFGKAEEEKMGAGTHERLHALMDKMVTEVLPA